MPKEATTFELALPERDAETPAYRWLYASLRAAILEGRLRAGAQLPATRELAAQYGLSRGTIVRAFEELKSEGYLEGSMGSGTYVRRVLPEDLLHARRSSSAAATTTDRRRLRLSDYGSRVCSFPGTESRLTRAFRANLPALDLFPTTIWAQIATRRWRTASAKLLSSGEPMGFRPLRVAVSDYLNASRGVNCAPEQVAIIAGVQGAIDLVARLLLNPGDRVYMENPGYIGAEMIFNALGAKIAAAPVDDEGIALDAAALRGVRLIYVTPGHQFPLGVVMSLARRLALLERARRVGAFVLEDDYDSEYRYLGGPLPSLQGLDRGQVVIFAGSFSKVLFPSLRLGYVVLPAALTERFAAAISMTARHAPLPEQAILSDFITEGHFGRHLRRMRQVYAERSAELFDAARQELKGLLEIPPIEAGLQTVGWLCEGVNAAAAAKAAANRGVEVTPLTFCTRGRVRHEGLQLGFAALDKREIRRGARQLAIALRDRFQAGNNS
jgi:GntR family transcriptional regulator/MocR family aminotransferase